LIEAGASETLLEADCAVPVADVLSAFEVCDVDDELPHAAAVAATAQQAKTDPTRLKDVVANTVCSFCC
jgi:hypothetical protein